MNKRKQALLEHALSLFVEKGIAKTSIQEIIDRSGISKGTFYNYFSSKIDCISAILEQARYDATMKRSELMIGKNIQDRDIFIEQISVLTAINTERGLNVVFEEMLYSGDKELKKLMLKYRINEVQWLATRLDEIFNFTLREKSIEIATIFLGILQNLVFMKRAIHQQDLNASKLCSVSLSYVECLVPYILENNTTVLDVNLLNQFTSNIPTVEVNIEDIKEQFMEFNKFPHLTKNQLDIIAALENEFLNEGREIVLNALINAFNEVFSQTIHAQEAQHFANTLWYYTRQNEKNCCDKC